MTDLKRRPPAVTIACVGAGFVALMLLIQVTTVLSDWGSLELQDIVTTALDQAGLAARGVGLDTALTVLQVTLYVIVVVTIAMIVLAVYTVRGDRPSRMVLTVLCALGALTLTLGGGFGGLLPAVVMGAVAFVLWTPEARVWFDLKNDRTPSPDLVARAEARQRRMLPPASSVDGRRADVDAIEGRGPVAPPAPGVGATGPAGGVAPPPPPWPTAPVSVRPRALPGALIGASVTMIVGSAISASYTALMALLYLLREVDPAEYERIGGQELLLPEAMFGLGDDQRTVVLTVIVLGLLTLVAGIAVLVAIALLFGQRRLLGTAIVLTTFAAAASAVMLPTGLVITAAAVVTFLLLRQPSVRQWAAR